jgi:hypothetical protein
MTYLLNHLLDKKLAVGQSALRRVALHYRIPRRGAFPKTTYRLWRFIFWHKKIITAKAAKIIKKIPV